MESGTTTTTEVTVEHQKEEPGSVEDFNAAQQTHYVTEDDKVRVEYIETTGENIVQIVDFGNNFSTAIVSTCDQTAEGDDQGNGIVTVISESQLQESGITYEYIPIKTIKASHGLLLKMLCRQLWNRLRSTRWTFYGRTDPSFTRTRIPIPNKIRY
jgi:hypothetical protein